MNRSDPVRVALVHTHELFSECLQGVLHARGFDCHRLLAHVPPVARAGPGSLDDLGARLVALRPDVALIKADLGPGCSSSPLIESASRAGMAVAVLGEADDVRGAEVVPMSASLPFLLGVVERLGNRDQVLDGLDRDRPGLPVRDAGVHDAADRCGGSPRRRARYFTSDPSPSTGAPRS